MRRLLLAAAAFGTALLGLPATEALPAEPTVFAVSFQFAPAALVVPLGTPVTFTNLGGAHTWTTADGLVAANAAAANDPADTNCAIDGEPGEDADPDTCNRPLTFDSFTHVFQTTGTFAYFCEIHTFSKMMGVVQVV